MAEKPAVVTLNVPGVPIAKAVLSALVICGGACAWAKAAKPVANSNTKKVGMRRTRHGKGSGINRFGMRTILDRERAFVSGNFLRVKIKCDSQVG